MKISLDALLVLDAIEKNGSFSAAAEELHRVPSALTYTIQKLEQDLSIQIFDRSGHKARLTPQGERLLNDGRYLLDVARRVEHRTQQQTRGWESELSIVIGDLIQFGQLVPILTRFDALQTGTRLRFTKEVFGGIWDALYDDRADLVIGAPGQPPPGDFFTREIGVVSFAFVVAPNHPLADITTALQPHELRQHKIISVGDTSRRLSTRTAGILEGQEVLTVHSAEAKLTLLLAGLGSGYLPRSIVTQHVKNGTLIEKTLAEKRGTVKMYLSWKDPLPGKALTWFIQQLENAAQQQLLTF